MIGILVNGPLSRRELYLAKIAGMDVVPPEPITREEMFLAKKAGMDVTIPEPSSRAEMYMAAAAGMDVTLPEPSSRYEMFLAKMAGMDIATPEPSSSLEAMLSQAAGGSSGGAGGGTYEKYSWEGVFASIKSGTYATDYAIGDMIPLDLGSEGLINMQIAAFDTDDLADGSGKAPITWTAQETLSSAQRMNPSIAYGSNYETAADGTGAIGGWEKCEMRAHLKNTIKPMLPEIVRNSIKEVTKTHVAYDTSLTEFTQTTTDDVWIPSYSEAMTSNALYVPLRDESAGPAYSWLRDAYNVAKFRRRGGVVSSWADFTNLAPWLCFCT